MCLLPKQCPRHNGVILPVNFTQANINENKPQQKHITKNKHAKYLGKTTDLRTKNCRRNVPVETSKVFCAFPGFLFLTFLPFQTCFVMSHSHGPWRQRPHHHRVRPYYLPTMIHHWPRRWVKPPMPLHLQKRKQGTTKGGKLIWYDLTVESKIRWLATGSSGITSNPIVTFHGL